MEARWWFVCAAHSVVAGTGATPARSMADGAGRLLLDARRRWWRRRDVKWRCGEDGGAVFLLFLASFSGGRRGWRRRLPWRVEGEEKIRVRVLGDEDDDVAESDWLIW